MYVCLRLMSVGKRNVNGTFVSTWDRDCMHVKDDTWQRGLKEIRSHDIVRTEMGRVTTDRWTTDLKPRIVYILNNEVLINNSAPRPT